MTATDPCYHFLRFTWTGKAFVDFEERWGINEVDALEICYTRSQKNNHILKEFLFLIRDLLYVVCVGSVHKQNRVRYFSPKKKSDVSRGFSSHFLRFAWTGKAFVDFEERWGINDVEVFGYLFLPNQALAMIR